MRYSRPLPFVLLIVFTSARFAAAADFQSECNAFGRRISQSAAARASHADFRQFFSRYASWTPEEAEEHQDETVDFMQATRADTTYSSFMLFNEPGRTFSKALFYKGLKDLNQIIRDPMVPRPQLREAIERRLDSYLASPVPDLRSLDPFVDFSQSREDRKKIVAGVALAPALCQGSGSPGCAAGVRRLFTHLRFRSYSGGILFNYTGVASKFLRNPLYYRGTLLAAKKILSRVAAIEAGEKVKSRLYPDVLQAFQDSGLKPAAAREAADLALMFYGLRGSTYVSVLAGRYFPSGYNPLLYAHSVIALGIGYLDKYTFSDRSYYSLPEGFTSDCVYGKTYRFWLAAFQARYLKTLTGGQITDRAASTASQTLAMVYSAFATFNGRQELNADFDVVESPLNNGHRIDLVFSSMGSLVPTRSASRAVDAGDFFSRMIDASRPPGPQPKVTLDHWKDVIAPFAMYD